MRKREEGGGGEGGEENRAAETSEKVPVRTEGKGVKTQ